jgi:hypothetical protein
MRASTAMMIASSTWLVFSPACGGSVLLGDNEDPMIPGDAGPPPPRRGRPRADAGSPLFGGNVGPIPDASASHDSSGAGDDADASIDDAAPWPDAIVAPIGYVTLSSCGYTQVDPHNCGTCGHDCNGGACDLGACVPLPPGALATGLIAPVSVAVDATNVYWLSQGIYQLDSSTALENGLVSLMKCAKTGCNNRPTVLASGTWDDVYARDRLEGIVSDGTNVYWAGENSIFSCGINGCNNQPKQIASPVNGGPPWVISVNATRIYAASSDDVFSCPLGGCVYFTDAGGGPEDLWAGSAGGVTIDSTTAYWNSSGAILSCALNGCNGTPNLLTSPPPPGAGVGQVVASQGTVYWNLGVPFGFSAPDTNSGPGYSTLPPFAGNAAIFKCESSGCNGQGIPVATGLTAPMGLTTDGTSVYFTDVGTGGQGNGNNVGRVGKCAVSGCGGNGTTIADKLQNPRGVAVDGSRVYWADFGSGVLDGAAINSLSVDGRIMMSPK